MIYLININAPPQHCILSPTYIFLTHLVTVNFLNLNIAINFKDNTHEPHFHPKLLGLFFSISLKDGLPNI